MISMVESSSLVCSRSGRATFSPTVIQTPPFTNEEKQCSKNGMQQNHQRCGSNCSAGRVSTDMLRTRARKKRFIASYARNHNTDHNALDQTRSDVAQKERLQSRMN